jgi:hypothetical protein
MNLIWQRLSSKLQITAKQWCIINERRMNRPQQVGASIGSHNPINPEGVAEAKPLGYCRSAWRRSPGALCGITAG